VAVNNPDRIIFVGEALVGNEAVDQLTKFDRALRDFSSTAGGRGGRGIDGMLVTKWDTVDDKVCWLLIILPWIYGHAGWCRFVYDLRYWSTYSLCWLRSGTNIMSFSSLYT
jgi:hypothetical protein